MSRRHNGQAMGHNKANHRTAPPSAVSADESGSVVVAVMILMIVMLLGAAALSRSQTSLRTSMKIDSRAAASSGSERGLAEAMSRLEHGEKPPFKGKGELVNGVYYYIAEQVDPTTVQVYAQAEVDGAQRAVEATMEGQLDVGFTLFMTESLISNQNDGSIAGRVGSNGQIVVAGQSPGEVQEIFTPDGSCKGCQKLIETEGPLDVPEPELPTGPTQSCSSFQWFRGRIDGKNGIPFVCSGDTYGYVIIYGDLEIVNPPLVLYVGANRIFVSYKTDANADGPPEDLQIYAQTNPRRRYGFYTYYTDMSATIYAPGRDVQPYGFDLTGSLTARRLQINVNQPLNAKPFHDKENVNVRAWQITSWETVPARL